jgi:hypothetical protein
MQDLRVARFGGVARSSIDFNRDEDANVKIGNCGVGSLQQILPGLAPQCQLADEDIASDVSCVPGCGGSILEVSFLMEMFSDISCSFL